ncbi:ATP-binding cassette domain-containing protein [Streptomyces bathyalis]|uniref:ATP-binding cassette domain-containing protein n=1 Tax=Streptomyces bathyalis TaxID=2710756 RepID=UPI001FEA966B|nr:ATP-binding cassette domain-containing protein [Streptomyces bathyalis]
MTAQLTLKDVTKSCPSSPVLDGIPLTASPGEQVAVVGDNGSGKSTPLRPIAHQEPPDEGTVTVSAGAHVGIRHLGQMPVPPGTRTVREVVDERGERA